VEEWLFLDWIQLQSAHVAMRHHELSTTIETNPANAIQSVEDDTPVATGVAAHAAVFELFVEISCSCECLKDLLEGG